MSRSLTRITARSFRRRDDALLDRRRRALDFRWWLEPGTWSFPALPRQEIDFVMNAALFVEPLQIRQKERLRGLHRLRRWPRRSSHGRDHSGYRPCTLTPRPAPKSTATLTDIGGVLSLLLFLRKRRSEVLEKNAGICSASSPRPNPYPGDPHPSSRPPSLAVPAGKMPARQNRQNACFTP